MSNPIGDLVISVILENIYFFNSCLYPKLIYTSITFLNKEHFPVCETKCSRMDQVKFAVDRF